MREERERVKKKGERNVRSKVRDEVKVRVCDNSYSTCVGSSACIMQTTECGLFWSLR